MTRIISAILLLFAACAGAQVPAPSTTYSVKGKFYVSVDDLAEIFVNGKQVHRANIGESQSPELELATGDRIVVQLRNVSSPRYFMLLFVGTDKQQMISFRHTSFKLPADPESTDFLPAQFARFNKYAKEDKGRKNQPFPYKNQSEWVWGEVENCSLAVLLTRDMFAPMRLQQGGHRCPACDGSCASQPIRTRDATRSRCATEYERGI